ncbi:MAG: NAD-dependent epimerase/dehydratase family protein [Anaerolineae bacterium]|nr:NAD-dependent epimerase/dehydratase family protein [Anaerolineae bacterium]
MRVLVTGGAGFLGSALANALVAQGHEVLVVDDLSAGSPERLAPSVLFHRGSVLDRPKLWTLLQGVDCVYHLAARVLVAESVLYPAEYNTVNVGGTVSLLEAMRDTGAPRVVLASSGAVYGRQQLQPVSEQAPTNPQSPYAVSKLSAEYYLHTVGALWNIETVALRIFNAFGPHQSLPASHAPVVPRFLQQALGGGSLVLFQDGHQTRDFVYIDDVVTALLAAGTASGINRRTINVGSGVETEIRALADLVLRLTGSHSNLLHSPVEDGGVSRLHADLTLARQLLNYRPRYSLEQGLRRTLAEDSRFRRS